MKGGAGGSRRSKCSVRYRKEWKERRRKKHTERGIAGAGTRTKSTNPVYCVLRKPACVSASVSSAAIDSSPARRGGSKWNTVGGIVRCGAHTNTSPAA